ncbi:MAG: HIRAN domain-containing protein [Desulfobulbaceae bacterium]
MERRDFLKIAGAALACFGLGRTRRVEAATVPLFNCMVAGFQYYEGPRCIHTLRPGDPLLLVREPHNPYDELAVAVHTRDNVKLGFIPRHINEVPAMHLNNGKDLHGLVHRINPEEPPWEMLEISVVMSTRDFGRRTGR